MAQNCSEGLKSSFMVAGAGLTESRLNVARSAIRICRSTQLLTRLIRISGNSRTVISTMLYAPHPTKLESPFSYSVRLSIGNLYPSLRTLISILGGPQKCRSALFSLADRLELLSDVTDIPRAELRAISYPSLPEDQIGRRQRMFAGRPVNERMLEAIHPKFCPFCLAHRPFYRPAAWDLELFVACPIHRVWLITKCPRCAVTQTWFSTRLDRCRCGQDLRTVPTASCGGAELELSSLVACRAGISLRVHSTLYPDSIKKLALGDLLDLITVAGIYKVYGRYSPRLHRVTAQNATEIFRAATSLLQNWPDHFLSKLHEHKAAVTSRTTHRLSIKRLYGLELARLLRRPAITTADRMIARALRQHLQSVMTDMPWKTLPLGASGYRVWISIEQTSKLLRISRKRVWALIRSGKLPGRKRRRGPGSTVWIL